MFFKKSKFVIATVLSLTLSFGLCLSVYADSSTAAVNSDTVEGDDSTTTDTQQCSVQYVRTETYTVIIPKTIVLDGSTTNPTQNFTVTCKGDLASGSSVKVTSDASFNMTQAGKDPVLCNVGYDHTFNFDAINTDTGEVTNGSLVVPTTDGNALSAGQWQGTFKFNITYQHT